ncbi:MAG TPA: hypothetical protein ACFYD4_09370 [Candidatus Wunengus sp. YC61]|uniref:hypothetical protein n=1 Tax=Candidatus Wunengus sp. YC61 TaxID=3367698 RepID=UPI004029292A
MAIYGVINPADAGDTRYEGFVKAAANFAILEGYQSITTVASHATTAPIWVAAGEFINYTGTATATNFPAAPQAGMHKILICAGASVFTHAGNITVQGDATFTAEAGDWVYVFASTTTTFKLNILKKTGVPVFNLLATTITDSDLTHAPDGNSVFDALALKAPLLSPSFTTPTLGTPASGNLVNCVGLPAAGLWTQTTAFTAAPPATAVATATFTFNASTTVTASQDCLALGVYPGMMIYNSTDDARASAKQILVIDPTGITITLASAYAATTGAAKQATTFGRTLTMTSDLTASMLVNMSLKYVIGGVTYYGQVNTSAAALLTVRGAALTGDVTALYYGGGTLQQLPYDASVNADGSANIVPLLTGTVHTTRWKKPKSYLVGYEAYQTTHDSHATHGKVTVQINATEVNTATGGLIVAANATWYSSNIDIATAAYDVNDGENVAIVVTQGGTADGAGLRANLIFLTP